MGYHRSVKLDTFTTKFSLDGEEVSDSRFGFIFSLRKDYSISILLYRRTDRLYRNVDNYQSTLLNITDERRFQY